MIGIKEYDIGDPVFKCTGKLLTSEECQAVVSHLVNRFSVLRTFNDLGGYLRHDPSCGRSAGLVCTCGLAELVRKMWVTK